MTMQPYFSTTRGRDALSFRPWVDFNDNVPSLCAVSIHRLSLCSLSLTILAIATIDLESILVAVDIDLDPTPSAGKRCNRHVAPIVWSILLTIHQVAIIISNCSQP